MVKSWSAIVAVVTSVTCGLAAARSAGQPAEPLARWVEELGSPQFARREAASRALLAAGRPAFVPLSAAIGGEDFEVASRGIEILREQLAAEDADLAAEAERLLEQSADAGGRSGRLAAATLEFHHLGLATEARHHLETLGAIFQDQHGSLRAEFAGGWRGGAEDLHRLTRIRGLRELGVHGVQLDEASLAVIGRLRRLERVELFGTGLEDAALAALAASLPAASIDVRRGGKLGVRGSALPGGPCEILMVEPGLAADQAGIRPGDVVLAINGLPVTDFDGLTAQVAGQGPGERLRLSVARLGAANGEPERLEFEVKLDAW